MNTNSLRRIEEVVKNSGVWSFLEIAQDSLYLTFNNVELGNPEIEDELILEVRFADDSFLMFFYNNIWDIDFISNFDYINQRIDKDLDLKLNNIRFLDFEYLDYFFEHYKKSKMIIGHDEFDINNIRNDFFLLFECDNIGVVVGGNQMDFFNKSEKLDDYTLKELSNQWIVYLIEYKSKKKVLKKDSMCENNSLIK